MIFCSLYDSNDFSRNNVIDSITYANSKQTRLILKISKSYSVQPYMGSVDGWIWTFMTIIFVCLFLPHESRPANNLYYFVVYPRSFNDTHSRMLSLCLLQNYRGKKGISFWSLWVALEDRKCNCWARAHRWRRLEVYLVNSLSFILWNLNCQEDLTQGKSYHYLVGLLFPGKYVLKPTSEKR